jgi:acetyl-CoA carboxylase carboxyltransferase component
MTADGHDDWGQTLAELEQRKSRSRAMGGDERLRRHRDAGKLDARARVERLVDRDTFREIGTLVGGDVPADGIIAGTGLIDDRPVMVGAEDFTTLAGTIGPGSNAKRYRIAELALRTKVPLVMLLEGAGFRPEERSPGRSPTDLMMQARCSGHVPLVAGVFGPSAGHGALVAPISDFTVMTSLGAIFTAGPPVVKESTGEDISKEELGGPAVAIASGLIHNETTDDVEALDQIRAYLSYFPSSAWEFPPCSQPDDATAPRPTDELLDLVPRDSRKIYDMRRVLDVIFDRPDWFEVQPGFGQAMICALAHLGGEPVAVVANQPNTLAGSIDAEAADKAAHFVAVADAFHLPLVFLADNPGMLPGGSSERQGVLRSGARMFAAQTLATTPKIHLTLRKAYGFGSMVMSMVGFDQQVATFAFPGATLGAMGAGASSRAMKADRDLTADLREAELQASYRSAAGLGFDELLDPRDTRVALLRALSLAVHSRQEPAAPVSRSAITP